MLISWDWLAEYLELKLTPDELATRLMMAGLNHESTQAKAGDTCIDLEVTSNRPDCLGHLGIAREAAVLLGQALKVPNPQPAAKSVAISSLAKLSVTTSDLCPRYTARVIQGVKVGPSPAWMTKRLATIGIAAINNIVDITNYVLMECGQPLHAFDFAKLAGGVIVVRTGKSGEKFQAINHKEYTLDESMCVIADERRAVALAGVMGGAETEVTSATRDVLIESALFDPSSIRSTARKLTLHSDSSYRFERGLDPEGVDWAGRRCCQLILELAGGELTEGVLDVGEKPMPRPAVSLRFAQLSRVLGIDVPEGEVKRILAALGSKLVKEDAKHIEAIPPSWRADLTREIDLVEEVARIHGYDKIPEDVRVPMTQSHRTDLDRVQSRVRAALVAFGFDEALTLSAVEENWSDAFSPWTDVSALQSSTPILRRADRLRRSLVPSLLGARQINEANANETIELFETAHAYWPSATGSELPREELLLAICSGGDFRFVKGALEGLLMALGVQQPLEVKPVANPLFAGSGAECHLGGELLGFVGEVSRWGKKQFELRGNCSVAEIRLQRLVELATLVPQYRPLSPYPAVSRDVNLVVPEGVTWSSVESAVRKTSGKSLEQLAYRDTWRDEKKLGAGKKSLLFSMAFRLPDGTLTSEQADQFRDAAVAKCAQEFGAELRQ
jgi:phenylalanyl-tRNA synthetase beta chain